MRPLRVVSFVLVAVQLFAQSYQGGLRGRVSDSAGGMIAAVKVTMIDEASGVARTSTTNSEGEYVFTAVSPATYTVTAESPGFKRFERKGVIVATQQFLTLDIPLEIGQVNESVLVTAEVPLLESSNASQGQVLDRQKLVDLPNSGRSPFMMAMVAPGTIPAGNPRFNRMQDQLGSSAISLAGGPVRGNNYLLDGIPISDILNRAIIIPTLEAVQEVKIQTNTYDAEMGRTGGGVFNTFLKSGSNGVHGAAFGYLRQPDWNANSFFNNRNRVPRPDNPGRNYGGAFGGPAYVPKLYNGKDRTFFWFAGEAYRQKSPNAREFAVPTPPERGGDFSQSLNRSGAVQPIFDPLTTRPNPDGGFLREPFAGNRIPAGRIDRVGANVAGQYYPLPNRPATPFLGANNFIASTLITDRADQFTAKLDHQFFPWWRASVSYLHYGSTEPSEDWFNLPSSFEAWLLKRHVDSTQLNNIFIANPTTVVTVRYGFNRFPNIRDASSKGFDLAALGFAPAFAGAVQYRKFPRLLMQTFANLGARTETLNAVWHSKNLLGSISKFAGRHSFRGGVDYRVINSDFINFTDSAGVFNFDRGFSQRDPTNSADTTGSDLASLLLGYPASGSAPVTTKLYTFVRYYAGYFQDDLRVTPKFTLNLGLRYEWEPGLAERRNHITTRFDREVVSPLAEKVTGLQPHGGLLFAGVGGNKTTLGNPSRRKFSPRVGAAWAANAATIVRGGYGIFWAPPRYDADPTAIGALGYTQITPYVASNDGGRTPAGSFSDPFPSGLLQPVGNSLGLLTGVGSNIAFVNQNRRSAMVHQFSVDVQRQLPYNIAASLGYVASRSRHLLPSGTDDAIVNINQLEPRHLSMGRALLDLVDNPFFGNGGTGVIGAARVSRQQLLRPFPQFGVVNMIHPDSNHARYDSMVLKAQKRFSAGLTFLSSWTWAKNLDASFGQVNFYMPSTFGPNSALAPQNVYDLESEYGLSIVNVPHRFVTTATYELPFGLGKPLLHASRALNYFVGGWQVNLVHIRQSGFPLAIVQNQNLNGPIGAGVQRPNATGVSPQTSGRLEARIDSYINPAAFSTAPQFSFGNLSRTLGDRGPGQVNYDLSLFKTVSIRERFNAQFRAEAINAFNHPIFQGPNNAFGNANFGRIASQVNFPRFIQLGLRLYF